MHRAQDTLDYARRLIHVPIIHSPSDMGTMAADLEAAYVERFGRPHWDEYLALVENYWGAVRSGIEQLHLDYLQVDLYQDGLPVCGMELVIVEKAAATGSENHQLLLDLVGRGATLMGTEDPRLLLEEYRSIQAAVASGTSPAGSSAPASKFPRPEQTLSQRDAFIGQRIGQSLRPGRTGVLFLGMMHHVESYLSADIVVTRLAPTPSGRKGSER